MANRPRRQGQKSTVTTKTRTAAGSTATRGKSRFADAAGRGVDPRDSVAAVEAAAAEALRVGTAETDLAARAAAAADAAVAHVLHDAQTGAGPDTDLAARAGAAADEAVAATLRGATDELVAADTGHPGTSLRHIAYLILAVLAVCASIVVFVAVITSPAVAQ